MCVRLVPAQDIPFIYTRSHLSALQNCALLLSTNFQFFSYLKNGLQTVVIELCSAQFFFKNIAQLFIKFTHSSVAIELLTFCKNAQKIIPQESSRYSVCKQDWFFCFLCIYKCFAKRNVLDMNENYDD